MSADRISTRRPAAPWRCVRGLVLAALPALLGACDGWFTTFKEQPKVEPWEVVYGDSVPYRGQPQGSVPITGELVPAYRVSYMPLPAVVDSMSGLANPAPADERLLENGRRYFAINCAVCHGDAGMGDGPATRYGLPGIGIGAGSNAATSLTDGYIFGIIRNGRGLMPSYNRIEESDRWDVVNYLRGVQGRLGRQVETGPVGQPGEGGAAVPGFTRTAPTRPAPFHNPRGEVTP